MKSKLIALAICLASLAALAPASTLRAQSFDVRVYTVRPPTSITISATQQTIQWRTCPTCNDSAGASLSITIAKSGLTITSPQSSTNQSANDIYIAGDYQIRPASASAGPPFSANFPLHIRALAGELLITVTMPIEQYVQAVLAAESGDFKQTESLKAMSVAIRTYALRFRGRHSTEGFDFCDTTHCQTMSWSAPNPRIVAAAAFTQGESLQYHGAPAETYYYQNCGGETAAGSEAWSANREPYLVAHADPYCLLAGGLKWQSTISVADIDSALRAAGLAVPAHWTNLEVASRTPSGRAQRVQLTGGTPATFALSASTLRFAVDRALGWNKIRSDLYEVRSAGGQVNFSGRGSGHGVGLCQAGAEEMAREGKTYRDILNFYYPGTELVSLSKVVSVSAATAANYVSAHADAVHNDPAHAANWDKQSSERLDLLSTNPQSDSAIIPIAERILKDDERAIGWQLPFRPQLQLFPTLDFYRDTTGEPGWVAASVRAHTIRLQPLIELQRKDIVESTLRHEFFHLLVESRARAETPVWLREGIVLYLSSPSAPQTNALAVAMMTDAQMESSLRHPASRDDQANAYAAAQSRVAKLVQQHGKEIVLGWLSAGVPAGAGAGASQ